MPLALSSLAVALHNRFSEVSEPMRNARILADFRLGSAGEVGAGLSQFRCAPEPGHSTAHPGCLSRGHEEKLPSESGEAKLDWDFMSER